MSAPAASAGHEWREIRTTGFMQRVGGLMARGREGGGWIYGLRTGEEHANSLGLVHGGVLTTLGDQAMSLTAWEAAGRVPVVTMQLSATFLRAARAGEVLEAFTDIESNRSGTLVVTGRIETERGRVAVLNGIWKVTAKPAAGA